MLRSVRSEIPGSNDASSAVSPASATVVATTMHAISSLVLTLRIDVMSCAASCTSEVPAKVGKKFENDGVKESVPILVASTNPGMARRAAMRLTGFQNRPKRSSRPISDGIPSSQQERRCVFSVERTTMHIGAKGKTPDRHSSRAPVV